jgi:Short-chain alcohol dehydrogenase of unknown specificity
MKRKIALITGATSGIGEGCARRFAEGGYNIIATGRRGTLLASLKTEIEDSVAGAMVLPLEFDVRDRKTVQKVLSGIPEEWTDIDVLINNAGLARGLRQNTAETSRTGMR